jgi:hypothetical protein
MQAEKQEIINRIHKELKEAGIEYWFLPLVDNDFGYDSFRAFYNFSMESVESKKQEGYILHFAGLCYTVMSLFTSSFKHPEGKQLSTEEVLSSIYKFSMHYNKHLRDSDPNFTGKYDEKGFPIY